MIRVPSGLVTTRDLTIAGVAVPAGTTLEDVQIEALHDLQALLGKGWVAPAEDIYARKTRLGNPQPTYLAPVIYKAVLTANAPSVPGAPTNLVATSGNTTASIAFTAGSANHSHILNYQYKVGSGSWTSLSPADAASPVTITGLTNGSQVGIKLRAVNAAGAGAESASVNVTPHA